MQHDLPLSPSFFLPLLLRFHRATEDDEASFDRCYSASSILRCEEIVTFVRRLRNKEPWRLQFGRFLSPLPLFCIKNIDPLLTRFRIIALNDKLSRCNFACNSFNRGSIIYKIISRLKKRKGGNCRKRWKVEFFRRRARETADRVRSIGLSDRRRGRDGEGGGPLSNNVCCCAGTLRVLKRSGARLHHFYIRSLNNKSVQFTCRHQRR